ncbi:MAG: hypothetical protein IJ196_07945 [Prevotella sp.]|nr:hypothetical protein [Prevotella sp.]
MKKVLLALSCLFLPMMADAQLTNTGYYRIRNANASTSDDYVSLVNDAFNYNTIVSAAGGGTKLFNDTDGARDKAIARATQYLEGDINLVSGGKQLTDPSTVMYFVRRTGTSYDVQAQGTGVHTITTGTWKSSVGNFDFNDIYLSISTSDNLYSAYIQVKKSYLFWSVDLGNMYFQDASSKFTASKTNTDHTTKWYITPIDENENYFAVQPSERVRDSEGNCWVTLCTAFPYTIPMGGGVEGAYFVRESSTEDGQVFVHPVKQYDQGQTVPAGTPVLLKCTSTEVSDCKLKPTGQHVLGSPTEAASGTNALSGTYMAGKTANDDANYRVLNVNSAGVIGFYKLNKSKNPYMPANKAFLDKSKLSEQAQQVSTVYVDFDFVEDETTGIDIVAHQYESQPLDDVCYDLQGRRVDHPSGGIYIKNGRKVVVK